MNGLVPGHRIDHLSRMRLVEVGVGSPVTNLEIASA
jgi:hypothetical protein